MKALPALFAIAALAAARPVPAQVSLPGVELPRLPQAVEQPLGQTVGRSADALRRLRIDSLLRERGDALERDPGGDVIVRGEVAALDPDPAALAAAIDAGFTVLRDRPLEGLGLRLVVLRAPPGMSTTRALRRLRRGDRSGTYDYNHIYFEGATSAATDVEAPAAEVLSPPAASPTGSALRIGMVDGGVDGGHPALAGATIHRHGCDGRVVPNAHGTAVASLLVGHSDDFVGAQPGAVLYAADAFCGQDVGGSIGLVALGLDWLARESVPVVNISMVGPSSLLLTGLVRAMHRRGHVIVAAVGNDGPAAPPLYPAAYPGVVAVTGVDPGHRVLTEACRGEHVAFAALGSEVRAAKPGGDWSMMRGTSFAAPVVTGLLAGLVTVPDPAAAARAVDELAAGAIDLGRRGRDPVYGFGLVDSPPQPGPDSVK